MAEREATIARLEVELRRQEKKLPRGMLPDVRPWVEQQLQDLATMLKTDSGKAKAAFRRLNLQLTFEPIESKPAPTT